MSDRLEEIKYQSRPTTPEQTAWLIAEVERLREHWEACQQLVHNAEERTYQEHCRANDALDEVVALRGALQALVDAAWPEPAPHTREEVLALMEQLEAARAAAVALLAGPGGET